MSNSHAKPNVKTKAIWAFKNSGENTSKRKRKNPHRVSFKTEHIFNGCYRIVVDIHGGRLLLIQSLFPFMSKFRRKDQRLKFDSELLEAFKWNKFYIQQQYA